MTREATQVAPDRRVTRLTTLAPRRIGRVAHGSQLASKLTARDREVVRLRFEPDMVQQDIATCVGCSQMHASRILRRAVVHMRAIAERPPATG